jgi:hypothetical protein
VEGKLSKATIPADAEVVIAKVAIKVFIFYFPTVMVIF